MKQLVVLLTLLVTFASHAQLTPPGMGRNANADLWLALGFRETLGTTGKFQSMTYVGVGRESTKANFNPLQHQGIIVLNQEVYHRFRKSWNYSLAASYRRQHEYVESMPYGHAVPGIKQEFRTYGRLTHSQHYRQLKLSTTFRQEFRAFYTPDFHRWEEALELRSRLKVQAVLSLSHRQQLSFGAEALFATTREETPNSWTPFNYTEARFTAFYTIKPPHSKAAFSIGYMNNLIGTAPDLKVVHYLSVDVIFTDLFDHS